MSACTEVVVADLTKCLWVRGLEQAESRRIGLSSDFCLES